MFSIVDLFLLVSMSKGEPIQLSHDFTPMSPRCSCKPLLVLVQMHAVEEGMSRMHFYSHVDTRPIGETPSNDTLTFSFEMLGYIPGSDFRRRGRRAARAPEGPRSRKGRRGAEKPMWGGGKRRADLEVLHKLNATMVRLYGNDPTLDHLLKLLFVSLVSLISINILDLMAPCIGEQRPPPWGHRSP